ncbi:MAG: hypothetical protein AMK69_17125, partial [Nitrospira bacterium SG8_3]
SKVALDSEDTLRDLYLIAHGFEDRNAALESFVIKGRSGRCDGNGVAWTKRLGFDDRFFH